MKMFGTNGIRGVVNGYLSTDLCTRVGRAVGAVLGPGPIAMATDTRVHLHLVKLATAAGLMSVGVDVIDLGRIPTPALQLYVKEHPKITGGVMITASHNPPEYNGIKCISSDGTECCHDEERAIEDTYDTDVPLVGWRDVGSMRTDSGAGEAYICSVVSKVDVDAIRSAHLTVCLDCANGVSCRTSPELLKRLWVRCITLNADPQGEFPGHLCEPTPENLTDLVSMVRATGADLGVAHDGDADRVIFVDGDGNFVTGDQSLALLAGYVLSRSDGKATVVTPVATSSLLQDTVEAAGGTVYRTAVGSPLVARRMMSCGGVFGGEGSGGLIFAEHQYCRDGAMGLAVMLECIAKNGPLAGQIAKLPKWTRIDKAYPCSDKDKTRLMETISKYNGDGRVDTTDGVRIDTDEGWVLVRPSGTEPKVRICAESRNPETARKLSSEFEKKVLSILGGV